MGELLHLNNTTFRPVPGGDVSAIITAGGKDPEKFVPNLNVGYSFGGGEEYFDNLNRTDKIITGKSEVKFDGEKVRLIEGSDIDEIYVDELGRTKWDVLFEKCPESMVLEWRRTCSPGLTAYYQPALTEEEIKEGSYRPPDVDGSYAIYCDKAHNWIRPLDSKKEIPRDWRSQIAAGAALGDVNISAYRDYKTGKVGHKYRPFVIDADGRTEWCTLLIVGNVERVTLPKEFMVSAKYPVRLDPTIGYTSAGATSGQLYSDQIRSSQYTPSVSGSGGTVYMYAQANTDDNAIIGVYDGASSPEDKISSSEGELTAGGSAGWVSASIVVSLSADVPVWIAALVEANVIINYDSAGTNTYVARTYENGLPATQTGTTSSTRHYSMYLEYTESGDSSSVPAIINHLRNQGVM